MTEHNGFIAECILNRLDLIFEKSAKIFSEDIRISIKSENHFESPSCNGFFYSVLFDNSEDNVCYIKVEWFKADSLMRTFPVQVNATTIEEVKNNLVKPILLSFNDELANQFFTEKADISNLMQNSNSNIDFFDCITFQIDLFHISPSEKKTVKFIFPRKTLFNLLCALQFPKLENLNQNQIDKIIVNFTQKENVIPFYESISSNESDLETVRECKALSNFMEKITKKMYKSFSEYRNEAFDIKVLHSKKISDSDFSELIDSSDSLFSAKISGKMIYLKWNKEFFSKTFLKKIDFESELQMVEREIFRMEYAVPTFDAIKSVFEVQMKKYLIVSSISFNENFDKSNTEVNGYCVSLLVEFCNEKSIANIYFPKDSVEYLKQSRAFEDIDSENIIKWQFPIGNFKNTEISLGAFAFDEHRFNSGKTFVLEKEIGDTVEIIRNSKCIARGEVFIRNGKKAVRIKEVYGTKKSEIESKN